MAKTCPLCGCTLTKKLAFKDKCVFDRRYTLICSCGFATIHETTHEASTRAGQTRRELKQIEVC